ncbi:MAG: thiamine pyrophosphate-binding protein [Gammaproteobacteria bacterium]|nr:thiamine pyrophosphate-binding protein [Gammaproteobacteria bacterium]
MPRLTGAEAIVHTVMNHGVDTIFGLPGGQLYYLYDAFYKNRDRLNLITSRHEQGAAYMALGYAHSTGKVGVYDVVPGPGVLNTTAALCTAWGCNAPVLCLTGQVPTVGIGSGAGYLHELPDQLALLRGLTKWAERIERVEDAPGLVAEAFRQLRTGRPRPVEIEMAPDVMEMQADIELPEPVLHYEPAEPDPDAIAAAARELAASKKPLIMIGGGARDAGEELLALAEMVQAPVVSFRHGKGVISDRHYLSQTYPAGHRLWADADVVLAVGTRLKYPQMYWGTEGLKILRIDIDPEEIERVLTPAVGICADARVSVAALLEELPRHLGTRASRQEELETLKAGMQAEYERIQPQLSFLKVMREELPDDGYFVDEITQTGFASWYGFPSYLPRHFISSGYQGTLGYGYATALGVKVAHPDKPVLQISGDGGFMYNVQELATAVAENIALVTVIFRDNRFGNVARDLQNHFGDENLGAPLRNPDFVALAESFGALGLRATTPEELRGAIRQGFAAGGPVLIEVPVDTMASPWEFIMLPQARP